ncbi:hypothetical protein ACFQI7_14425 [Paenibacillus allorhizosphaerae]|uniref:Uncharacterized protein n=1 Tax=Paenibacillus allorhizosphaerae TaxID=2849866 RepID=A0ABM8VD86_9BACL|nr:hypothetical protein [Paenibacillus allorhizosphaerae]CAG7626575.1 hypothetical protein PAECIP111802_01264 [Paenibacillus allorhizosphaerae]
MGMPEIPSGKNRPSLEEAGIDLLESIALEEMAIAHLVNAEAENVQAFVGKHLNFPTDPTNDQIITFNVTIGRIMETLMFKELFLLRKLETISALKSQNNDGE